MKILFKKFRTSFAVYLSLSFNYKFRNISVIRKQCDLITSTATAHTQTVNSYQANIPFLNHVKTENLVFHVSWGTIRELRTYTYTVLIDCFLQYFN